jgi:REP element-mobilizing transposase RayT
MKKKYQNKYRVDSSRLQKWDYASNAAYFITICTQNREHFFGNVVDGNMQLSEIGKIAENEWHKTLELRPDMNLQLDAFVVMPNHVHGIVIIGKNEFNSMYRDAMHCVSKNVFGPQSKNLASIIRGYKIGVTVNAKKIKPNWAWQPLYYEHVIRNDKSFDRIRNYILENPKKWNDDKFH